MTLTSGVFLKDAEPGRLLVSALIVAVPTALRCANKLFDTITAASRDMCPMRRKVDHSRCMVGADRPANRHDDIRLLTPDFYEPSPHQAPTTCSDSLDRH